MKTRYVKMRVSVLLLAVLGFGTNDAQSQEFSSFEYNQASNTVILEWNNSSNAFYEMQASTNIMIGLWGQEGGWTNILGTNPTNQIHLSADEHPNGFFLLFPRSNSPQNTYQNGFLYRINTTTDIQTSDWFHNDVPYGSSVDVWDEVNSIYNTCSLSAHHGWLPNITLTNNQTFIFFGGVDGTDPDWPFAYLRDWRLTSPAGDLPVTGDVLIEWAAFESYSTPSNPIPDIPVVDVTIINSSYAIVTNWSLVNPSVSSVIWESDSNPDGYYIIIVDIGGNVGNYGSAPVATIDKQVYLYN